MNGTTDVLSESYMLAGVACISGAANAFTTYDNFGAWDGNVTNEWLMQAQKFPVPVIDNVLLSWRSEFDAEMSGAPVNFTIRDVVSGQPGGATYFSSNANVPGGGGVVAFTNMNLALVSGQQYAAVWDFLGYSGPSIHFTANDVVPGNGTWFDGSTWKDFPTLDQKLTATFDVVPEPASMLALTAGFAVLLRRRKK